MMQQFGFPRIRLISVRSMVVLRAPPSVCSLPDFTPPFSVREAEATG
jgi:hypothetical protein